MSALGQKQTSGHVRVMSALLPIADIVQNGCDVRFVPIADIGTQPLNVRFRVAISPPRRRSIYYGGRGDDAAADSCKIMLGGRHADNRSRRRRPQYPDLGIDRTRS